MDECKPVPMGSSPASSLMKRTASARGRAVQVDPIEPTLKAPGPKLLKVRYDKSLSDLLSISTCAATAWGHDFRPDYKKLGDLKKHFPARGFYDNRPLLGST